MVAAAMLVVPLQAALAMDSSGTELESVGQGSSLEMEAVDLTELRDRIESLSAENTILFDENQVLIDENQVLVESNGSLQADNSSLALVIEEMTRENDRLSASLVHFDELFGPLEADRQLLFELRKGLPETRGEAEAQLDRIERLALTSNPSRLGQLVDRVNESAPAFLDWRFTEHTSTQEASASYISSGANAFDSSMDDFRSAVLFSVANRIDGLLNVIDRVR